MESKRMKSNTSLARRTFLLQTLALGSSTGCGYLLYPERKGARGNVDATILIFDLLWLLVGIIPGVICLAVDFTTGCIYKGGGSGARDPRATPSPEGLVAELSIDGEIIADGRINGQGQMELAWRREAPDAELLERAELTILGPDGALAHARLGELV
jgi:hypothetical protein